METKTLIPTISNIDHADFDHADFDHADFDHADFDHAMMKASHEFRPRDRLARRRACRDGN
jgi:hypothetical protein